MTARNSDAPAGSSRRGADARVAAPTDTDRVRTRWQLDRQRHRRRVSNALDELCVRMYGADEAAKYGIRDRRRGGR